MIEHAVAALQTEIARQRAAREGTAVFGDEPFYDDAGIVRAVLRAIREPSADMKAAGFDVDITESFDTTADQTWRYVSEEDAGAIWQAMIDVALEEA